MADVKRHVIDRFPAHEQTIRRLFEANTSFNELCHEYGQVTESLHRLDRSVEADAEVRAATLRRRQADLDDQLLALMQQTARA